MHRSRYFLFATEFFAGMSVMAIELGASRLLAPYFSSSQIVWTIIIGTIMIAMALGNLLGGRMADRNPDPSRLYGRLIVAAVWTAAIPVVGKYVIAGVSLVTALITAKNFLIWASFASCLVLFVFPLMLLGTVTPSLVKYTMESLDSSGRTVGWLNALNTIGSIIGTFLPTFVTIPSVGTALTFIIFSGILLLLALAYFISVKKRLARCVVAIVLAGACGVLSVNYSFAFWLEDVEYEGESMYNYLQVTEDDSRVVLSTNVAIGVQSVKMKSGGLTGMYYDYALAAPLMAGSGGGACDLLILGLGTGTYAAQCLEYYGGMTVDGVEIDGKIAELSREYFGLPEAVNVTVGDGRAYLATEKTYDVIMVDAYQDITIPFQMSTAEFFSLVREHLAPGGVMVVNMNMRSSEDGAINEYLRDTICSVFECVWTVPVAGSTNMELFASDNPGALRELEDAAPGLSDASLSAMMGRVAEKLTLESGGELILTDDKAPVELLGMQVLDELVSDELSYYKGLLKDEGVSGVIKDVLG